jgi:hypothetical protein
MSSHAHILTITVPAVHDAVAALRMSGSKKGSGKDADSADKDKKKEKEGIRRADSDATHMSMVSACLCVYIRYNMCMYVCMYVRLGEREGG